MLDLEIVSRDVAGFCISKVVKEVNFIHKGVHGTFLLQIAFLEDQLCSLFFAVQPNYVTLRDLEVYSL